MSAFYDLIEEYLGNDDAITEIRVVVRRLWFYDFVGVPVRLWQGKGKIFTSDNVEWLGTIDANDTDYHRTPNVQDGRDGSSATYEFTLNIPDLPGQSAFQTYEALKSDQSLVAKRLLTCYLAVFKDGEGMRPSTPIVFFKQLTMLSCKFSEKLEEAEAGKIVRRYRATVIAKDSNFGRSNTPRGTYADTIQKQRARELGVTVDKGSEFLALLANRTYQIP